MRSLNGQIRLVIRSAPENLNELLRQNLGNFVAFEATQLPAKSFALAALSSETRGFFSLDDTLNGKLLAEIAYGYGIVPILHAKVGQVISKLMPSDDIKLAVGDRLIVLATIEGFSFTFCLLLLTPYLLIATIAPHLQSHGQLLLLRLHHLMQR